MVVVRTSVYTVVRFFRLSDEAAPTLDIAEDLVSSLVRIHYHAQDFSIDYAGDWKWDIWSEHGHIGVASVKHIPGVAVGPAKVHNV